MAARLQSPAPLLVAALAATAALLGAIAGFDPKIAIGLAFGMVFVVLIFQDLTIGVCLMAFLAFADSLPALEGALSLAKVAGFLLGLSWLAMLVTRSHDDLLARHPGLTYVLVLFLGWTTMSVAWAQDKGDAFEAVIRYAPNVLLIPIVFSAVRTRRQATWVLAAIVGGALMTALLAVAGPASDPSAVDVERAQGLAGGANELAAALVAGLVLALAFAARQARGSALRWLLVGTSAICALGIFLSLSRGVLVGLVGYLVAAFFISENYSKLLWLLLALGPALLHVARRESSSA